MQQKEKLLLLLKDLINPKYLNVTKFDNNIIELVIDIEQATSLQLKQLEDEVRQLLIKHYPNHQIKIITSSTKSISKAIKGVKKLILVASCKGGVGKSSIAAGLTLALRDKGFKVGLLDADIYGPSIPEIFKQKSKPETIDGIIQPLEAQRIKMLSVGNLVEEGKALAWRGPMVTKLLFQLLRQTNWQGLDYLIVDMPPGTGDVYLSMAENYQIDGVVVVSTPQELAVLDTRKSLDVFKKLKMPIIGIIENMSYFEDSLGKKNYIFGKDKVKEMAGELAIPFLDAIPIMESVASLDFEDEKFKQIMNMIIKSL